MERCTIVLLLILACLSGTSSALSVGEMESLVIILDSFPSLILVNPMDQYVLEVGKDLDYGGSWLKPFSQVCSEGDGWDIHGIHCFEGHVDGIRFSNAWGRIPNPLPMNVSGLEWLHSFTLETPFGEGIRPNPESAAMLMTAVLDLPSLKRLAVDWTINSHFPITALQGANLTHLQLSVPSSMTPKPGLSWFSYLEEVVMGYFGDFSPLAPSASTLRRVTFKADVSSFNSLENLHQLEYLRIEYPAAATPWDDLILLPASLRSFQITGWPGTKFFIDTATLETLYIGFASSLNQIGDLPSSLKSFSLRSAPNVDNWAPLPVSCELEYFSMEFTGTVSIPNSLTLCTSLKSIGFDSLPQTTLAAFLEINLTSTPLESLSIVGPTEWPTAGTLEEAQNYLCSLSTSLRVLTLISTNFVQLPACMSHFTALEELNLRNINFVGSSYHLAGISSTLRILEAPMNVLGVSVDDNQGWMTMATQFPNLTSLAISASIGSPSSFPVAALMNLPFLEQLNLFNLQFFGTVPSNFLEALPNLRTLVLTSNQLSGTIPSSGWAKLETVSVQSNLFTQLPNLVAPGAPNLKLLRISFNPLQSIPDDESFLSTMPQLRIFSAAGLSPQQLMPAFWSNGTHKLVDLDISYSSFLGHMPNMSSPYLRTMDVSHTNLCGPLPEVTGLMGMKQLVLSSNQFTGSIPASWGDNLAIYDSLSLSNTDVLGELPIPLFHPHGVPSLAYLYLDSGYFTGPLLNMSSFVNLENVGLEGVNNTWDFCSQNPDFPPSIGSNGCSMELHPSICECQSYYAACAPITIYCEEVAAEPAFSGPSAASGPPEAILPPNRVCITSPPAPLPTEPAMEPLIPPSASCPSPAPPQFLCENGQLVSSIGITIPILTLPANLGNIIVYGSLVSDTLIFEGLGTTLTVEGCVYLSDGITIELQGSTETKEPIILLEQKGGSQCTSSLQDLKTYVNEPKSCKKTKIKKDSTLSNNNRLAVLFEIDSSSCNTKWIILGSVLGAVVIIIVIGIILAYNFSPSFRNAISPFSARKTAAK